MPDTLIRLQSQRCISGLFEEKYIYFTGKACEEHNAYEGAAFKELSPNPLHPALFLPMLPLVLDSIEAASVV